MKLGDRINVTLVNTAGKLARQDSNFHFHGFHGKPYHAHSRVDTFVLPRHTQGGPPTTMVVRIPFEKFTGKFVFHCHILGHEDLGMMKTILVER